MNVIRNSCFACYFRLLTTRTQLIDRLVFSSSVDGEGILFFLLFFLCRNYSLPRDLMVYLITRICLQMNSWRWRRRLAIILLWNIFNVGIIAGTVTSMLVIVIVVAIVVFTYRRYVSMLIFSLVYRISILISMMGALLFTFDCCNILMCTSVCVFFVL